MLLIAPVSDRREPVQGREERGSAYASNWLERDRCWIVNGMGFRRLAEKGGENVEMIRLASITTGLDLAESSGAAKNRSIRRDSDIVSILRTSVFVHDSAEKRGCLETPEFLLCPVP